MPDSHTGLNSTDADADSLCQQIHILPVWRDAVSARIHPEIQRTQTDYSWRYIRPQVGNDFWLLIQTLRQLRLDTHDSTQEVVTTIAELAQLSNLPDKKVAQLLASEPLPGEKPWRRLAEDALTPDEIALRRRLIPRLRYTSSMKPGHGRPTRDGFAIEVSMDDPLIPAHERELEQEVAAALGAAPARATVASIAKPPNSSLQLVAKPPDGVLQSDAKPQNEVLQTSSGANGDSPAPEPKRIEASPVIAKPPVGGLQPIAKPQSDGLQVAKPQMGGATTTTTTIMDRSCSRGGTNPVTWQPSADMVRQLAERFALANKEHWSRGRPPRTAPTEAECMRLRELAQEYHAAAWADPHPDSTDGAAWVMAAITEGIDGGGGQVTISFLGTVLDRWEQQGFRSARQAAPARQAARPRAQPGPPAPAPADVPVDYEQILGEL